MFSLLVGLGVNCRSPRGSEEHQIAVDSTILSWFNPELCPESLPFAYFDGSPRWDLRKSFSIAAHLEYKCFLSPPNKRKPEVILCKWCFFFLETKIPWFYYYMRESLSGFERSSREIFGNTICVCIYIYYFDNTKFMRFHTVPSLPPALSPP